MTEQKKDPEPRETEDELALEKEKISDLDVPEEATEDVKGGRNRSFDPDCSWA
jgi:hypothetical protein